MWIIPNQSEKRFVSCLVKNGQKSIRLNPINSETSIRMNLNHSETKFSIRINPTSSLSKPNFQSEAIGMNRIESLVSDWFGFIRIHSDCCLGLNRIRSNRFLPFFIKRDKKCFSDWFGMIRIGSDTDIRMNRNSSDWLGINSYPILSPGMCSICHAKMLSKVVKFSENV